MRTQFINALLVDGTGSPSRAASITVDNDIIIEVGEPAGDTHPADKVIDLKGLALCPGFIDTHSHSDLVLLEDGMIWQKLRQGITTEVLGQDGISMAPLPLQYVSQWRKNIAGLEGTSDVVQWDYRDTRRYLSRLEQAGVGPNVCYLVPHGNVRMEAMGLGERAATETELQEMCNILQRELDNGGFGLSTGLIYPPCTYADMRELNALCSVAACNKVPLVIHQRSEADAILESMQEVLQLSRETGVHIHFSHFKICGKYNDPKYPQVVDLLDSAAREGLRVTFDQYPYVAGSTMLSAILPPWAHAGGTEELLKRLADPQIRLRMFEDIHTTPSCWDNFIAFAGVDGISITNVQTEANRYAIGKTLVQLGEIRKTDPVTAALDLILEEENGVSMVDFYGLEEHVKGFMLRPEMNVCTDGLMHGTPHPRTFGAFPRVLGKYSRDERLMPLEEAIRKMTLQPATTFGITKRGRIAEGWHSDIVVFNPDTVIDTATYTAPAQYPRGIELVMVNGCIVYEGETIGKSKHHIGHPPGSVLRRRF